MRRAAAAALALCLVAAAGCAERREDEGGQGGEPAAEERDGEGERPAREAPLPAVTAEGLGGLDAGARVDRAALARSFPGARVSGRGARYQVARGGEALFTVTRADDGALSSVRVVSRAVPSELGARVGDTYEALARAAGPLDCNGGLEERAREILCTPRRTPNVTFHFRVDDDRLAGDDIEPARQGRALAGRRVAEILWTPPR